MTTDTQEEGSHEQGAECLICGETGIEDVLAHKCPPGARPWREDSERA